MSSGLNRIATAWLVGMANDDSSNEDRLATVNDSDRQVIEVFTAVQLLRGILNFHTEMLANQCIHNLLLLYDRLQQTLRLFEKRPGLLAIMHYTACVNSLLGQTD